MFYSFDLLSPGLASYGPYTRPYKRPTKPRKLHRKAEQMVGDMGLTGGLKKTSPGVEDAEPVIQIPAVGLPCLERGRLVKKEANI